MKFRFSLLKILISGQAIFLFSCSMLGPVYVKSGYRTDSSGTIRKISIVIRKPEGKPELAPLISAIAFDHIKVKTGYEITARDITGAVKEDKCSSPDGTLIFNVEEFESNGRQVVIYIRGKLVRCRDNLLIWRAEGRYDGEPGDGRLKNLVRQYRREHGEIASLFTEPVYFLLKDIIGTLPDPEPVKR